MNADETAQDKNECFEQSSAFDEDAEVKNRQFENLIFKRIEYWLLADRVETAGTPVLLVAHQTD